MDFEKANCRQAPADLFYPERYSGIALLRAQQICNSCEVRSQCLSYAIDNREKFGIWGGTTPGQRSRYLRILRNSKRNRDIF